MSEVSSFIFTSWYIQTPAATSASSTKKLIRLILDSNADIIVLQNLDSSTKDALDADPDLGNDYYVASPELEDDAIPAICCKNPWTLEGRVEYRTLSGTKYLIADVRNETTDIKVVAVSAVLDPTDAKVRKEQWDDLFEELSTEDMEVPICLGVSTFDDDRFQDEFNLKLPMGDGWRDAWFGAMCPTSNTYTVDADLNKLVKRGKARFDRVVFRMPATVTQFGLLGKKNCPSAHFGVGAKFALHVLDLHNEWVSEGLVRYLSSFEKDMLNLPHHQWRKAIRIGTDDATFKTNKVRKITAEEVDRVRRNRNVEDVQRILAGNPNVDEKRLSDDEYVNSILFAGESKAQIPFKSTTERYKELHKQREPEQQWAPPLEQGFDPKDPKMVQQLIFKRTATSSQPANKVTEDEVQRLVHEREQLDSMFAKQRPEYY